MKMLKNQDDIDKKFLTEFAKSAMIILASYGVSVNRFGSLDIQTKPLGERVWEIRIPVTDGTVSTLPFINEALSRQFSEKYQKQLDAIQKDLGDDIEEWSLHMREYFEKGSMFVFLMTLDAINSKTAKFSLQLAFVSPEYSVIIRNPKEKSLGIKDIFTKIDNDEEEIYYYLNDYLNDYVFRPEAWRTARDRRIEYLASETTLFMLQHGLNWRYNCNAIERKCFASVLWLRNNIDLQPITNNTFKTECEKIIGSIYKPESFAGIIIKFDIGNPKDGIRVSGYAPIPYNPSKYKHCSDLLKIAEKQKPVFDMQIPEDQIDFDAEYAGELKKGKEPLENQAKKLGKAILEAYGAYSPKKQN